MTRGPKPQPTKIKQLRGNPGKRALNYNEPEAEPGIPEPPEHLSDTALEQWDVVAPQLDAMGILKTIDGTALEMYCSAYANWKEAQQQIAKYGPIIKTNSGYFQQSPYMQIANKAFEQMRSMLAEFGMTPSSRSRIMVDKPAGKGNRFADLPR